MFMCILIYNPKFECPKNKNHESFKPMKKLIAQNVLL